MKENNFDDDLESNMSGKIQLSGLAKKVVELAEKRGYWGHGAGVHFGGFFKKKDRLSKRDVLLNIILDQKIKKSYSSFWRIGIILIQLRFAALFFKGMSLAGSASIEFLKSHKPVYMGEALSTFTLGIAMAVTGLSIKDRFYGPFGNKRYMEAFARPDRYGPYWVVLDRTFSTPAGKTYGEFVLNYLNGYPNRLKEIPYYWVGITGEHHLAYIFPDEDFGFFQKGILDAFRDGKIGEEQTRDALIRLISYSDFIQNEGNVEKILESRKRKIHMSLAMLARNSAIDLNSVQMSILTDKTMITKSSANEAMKIGSKNDFIFKGPKGEKIKIDFSKWKDDAKYMVMDDLIYAYLGKFLTAPEILDSIHKKMSLTGMSWNFEFRLIGKPINGNRHRVWRLKVVASKGQDRREKIFALKTYFSNIFGKWLPENEQNISTIFADQKLFKRYFLAHDIFKGVAFNPKRFSKLSNYSVKKLICYFRLTDWVDGSPVENVVKQVRYAKMTNREKRLLIQTIGIRVVNIILQGWKQLQWEKGGLMYDPGEGDIVLRKKRKMSFTARINSADIVFLDPDGGRYSGDANQMANNIKAFLQRINRLTPEYSFKWSKLLKINIIRVLGDKHGNDLIRFLKKNVDGAMTVKQKLSLLSAITGIALGVFIWSEHNRFQRKKLRFRRNGGIDLNTAQMSMQVKKQGEDFKFDFNGTEIDAAQVTGATFTIRTMTPVTDLPMELGLTSPVKQEAMAA